MCIAVNKYRDTITTNIVFNLREVIMYQVTVYWKEGHIDIFSISGYGEGAFKNVLERVYPLSDVLKFSWRKIS